ARAVRDSTTLTCHTLTVFYSPSREVERIVADGEVEAIDSDRRALGDHAEYDNRSGVLTMTGHPRAASGERHVEGEEIVFTSGVDRVEVKKPRTTDAQVSIDAD